MASNSSARGPAWWPALLETPRLTLGPVTAEDLPSIERLWRDERVRRFLGGPVTEDKIAVRHRRLPGTPGAFAVKDRPKAQLVGMVTIGRTRPEVARRSRTRSYRSGGSGAWAEKLSLPRWNGLAIHRAGIQWWR
ncbi:hypothetical protein TNCT6_56720 [Streptomyces sp. 6-11-2]|nr:hypothetical protein TNCT6_56720 [Streptomyces sp. 6-11-2]